ncbi:MAG TPA: hypothetical protein VIY48_11265, partial [Candidatus Paceibacterota bacterium]
MNNPGLGVFSAAAVLPNYAHPLDFGPEEDEQQSDYVPPVEFGRWKNPGQSLRVPLHQGPSFHPSESPDDVLHGEVISPADQDSADRIINGDHDSDAPSANPYVERAREDLRTPGSDIAVDTLTRLLNGAHPRSMSQEAMNATHNWLSQRFTGVRVNPHHGVLEAASPAGSQLVKRHVHLPAVPEEPEKPVYSLTNGHGIFESSDPERLVRTMVAFQIVHNEIMAQQKKKEDDDDQKGNIVSTSGIVDWLNRGIKGKIQGPPPRKPSTPSIPPSAVFEPGHGIDKNEHGQLGGYVMDADLAPLNWWRNGDTAFSPGHKMRYMLDPHEAVIPRPDRKYPGHTYTYAPNMATGHTIPRVRGGIPYFVRDRIHPAAQGEGFDLPPKPKTPPTSGKVPKKGPRVPPHSPPRSLPPGPTPPPAAGPKTSAAKANDLCPVCASGYLEPYDSEFHECLNCGSLVKHVGFEKHADDMTRRPARGRGGLGRGLSQIDPGASAVGMGLNDDGSIKPDDGIENLVSGVHPLAGQEVQNPDEVYEAPTQLREKGQVGRRQASARLALSHRFKSARHRVSSAPTEADPLDVEMGKLGFQPRHRPGQSRLYTMQMPGTPGGYLRLTEGAQT